MQVYNILLILLGLIAIGLSGSQFSDVAIRTYMTIDLRLLNWIYVLAGLLGFCSTLRGRFHVVTTTVYLVSFVIGVASAIFYGFTTYRVVHDFGTSGPILEPRRIDDPYHPGKITISAIMIAVAALAAFLALIAALMLNKLIIFMNPQWSLDNINGQNKYIKIATDHISAMLTVMSALVELSSTTTNRNSPFCYKVSLALSIIAAVWCLKTVDVDMNPFYFNDLILYRGLKNKLVVAISIDSLFFNFRFLTVIQLLISGLLMALVVLGLIDVRWNNSYNGGELLWVAVLVFCTGMLGVVNINSLPTAEFVLSVICLAVSVEKMCVSINDVYQSATYSKYLADSMDVYTARIVLYSVQLGVGYFLTDIYLPNFLLGIGKFVRIIGSTFFFSLGILFYGIVMIGSYVVYELGKWRFARVPLRNPYYRIANGTIAVAAFFILHAFQATMFPIYDFANTHLNTIIEVALILAASGALACVICIFCCALLYITSMEGYISNTMDIRENSVERGDKFQYNQIQPMQQMEEQSVYWSVVENPYYYNSSKRYYFQPYQINSGKSLQMATNKIKISYTFLINSCILLIIYV
ncbi:unnamed protein product [Dracunculus medinensis]|uniref:Uncharacterized protein n=1 Tax=Dracunculus medinensis TaxID=318479 RepID=A0A3P7TBA6_DRAME|nr:unnamed protein product [Dracunculus medinensis]